MKKHIRDSIMKSLRDIREADTADQLMFRHGSLCGFLSGLFCMSGMSFRHHSRLHEINRRVYRLRSDELFHARIAA